MILTFFFMTMVASVLIGNCRGTRISVYHPSLASLTPDGYKKGNDGYLYKLHKEPKSWTDAQNACNGEDGNLAIIFNEKTRDVVHFLSEGLTVWIGATDQWEEGKWQTVTKEDIPYTFWYKGEPNDAYGGEDCAGMYSSKLMNDWRCYQAKPFVCQKAGKASTQSFEIFKKLTKISNNVKDIKDFVQGIYNKVVSGKHDPSFRKCCETLDCSKYRGKKKTTASGRLCQPWNSDVPHIINSDTKASMKSAGLTANYCRNPTQASTAWCYTMDEDKRWEYCDIPICSDVDDCGSQPCKHGNCIDEVDAYTCKCNVGYTGENCEINIDDCGSHLCKHGNCIDGVDAYYCQCYVGYTGEYCEINIDECGSQPCKHGNCIDGVGAYTCKCKVGYTGKNCEINIDDCGSQPCKHGNCIDGVGTYTCKCEEKYEGKNCDIRSCGGPSCIFTPSYRRQARGINDGSLTFRLLADIQRHGEDSRNGQD